MDAYATSNIANTPLGLFPIQQQQTVITTAAVAESVSVLDEGTQAGGAGRTLLQDQDPMMPAVAQAIPHEMDNVPLLNPPAVAPTQAVLDIGQLQAAMTETIIRSLQPQLASMQDNVASEIRSLNTRMEVVDRQFQSARTQMIREGQQRVAPQVGSEDPQLSGKRSKPAGPHVPEDPKGKRHQSAAAKQLRRNVKIVPDAGGARTKPEPTPEPRAQNPSIPRSPYISEDDLISLAAGSDLEDTLSADEEQDYRRETEEEGSEDEGSDSDSESERRGGRPGTLKSVVVQPPMPTEQPGPSTSTQASAIPQEGMVRAIEGQGGLSQRLGSIMTKPLPVEVWGEALHPSLVEQVHQLWTTTLDSQVVESVTSHYEVPANARYLKVQRTNNEVYNLTQANGRAMDVSLQSTQAYVVKAATMAASTLSKLLTIPVGSTLDGETLTALFQGMWDVFTVASFTNQKLISERKSKLTRFMPKEYSALRKQNFPESQELFGDNADALLESLYKAHATGQRRQKKGGKSGKSFQGKGSSNSKNSYGHFSGTRKKNSDGGKRRFTTPKGKKFPKKKPQTQKDKEEQDSN